MLAAGTQARTVSKYVRFSTFPFPPFNIHFRQISVPPSHTEEVAKLLLKPPVQLAGLAARDSLRLEAGMCLYGNDLDESTSPVEAGLSWVIAKDRKEQGGFIGAEEVLRQLKEGPPRRRVGFVVKGAPARREF